MENAKELKECLCCGSERLKLVLDLKEQREGEAHIFFKSKNFSEVTIDDEVVTLFDPNLLMISFCLSPQQSLLIYILSCFL